jgi:hypothetical protein
MTSPSLLSDFAWTAKRLGAAALGHDRRAAWRAGWLLLAITAAMAVVFAWLPAWNAPYQYDDYNTPVGDAASQSLTSFWERVPRTLRPLTKLTYALESSLGAHEAAGRRVLNAVLFAGCALLFAALANAARVPALLLPLLACLWAVHPVHAEMVVALAGRSVLLSSFLLLASALFVLRQRPLGAVLCAVLALLARETALPWLPACALLLAQARGVPARRIALAAFVALAAGALLLLSSSGLRALVVSAFGAAGAWNRLGLQWAALTEGTLMLFLTPAAFTPDMEFAPGGGVRLTLILSTLACYVVALRFAFSKARPLELRVFALLWLCVVVPTHSIVPKLDVLTARPFAASLAPLLLLASLGLAPRVARSGRATALGALTLGVTIALLIPLTRERAALYADPIALWADAAARTRHHVRPLLNLGTLLAKNGQLSEAESVFEEAVERDPTRYETRRRLSAVRRAAKLQGSSNEPEVSPEK